MIEQMDGPMELAVMTVLVPTGPLSPNVRQCNYISTLRGRASGSMENCIFRGSSILNTQLLFPWYTPQQRSGPTPN
jgi:hypothetical protein